MVFDESLSAFKQIWDTKDNNNGDDDAKERTE